ncbi:AGAP008432-PA-like protein [Anopheles sinensis]|uniref:AGAP008432-PA-like protein n=1 Tax=Anopheles sinensis TaxID=74873 RepID=A0A084VM95_ANOSI|nr:AGAP008432-PA-like protein [Anopheles sinensis]
MAQQVQQVFKAALAKTAGQRAMSTGIIGTMEVAAMKKATAPHSSGLHVSVQRTYPLAAVLPLPPNIDATETSRFSPLRSRDINASAMLTHQSLAPNPVDVAAVNGTIDVTVDQSQGRSGTFDPHVESYDCTGAVSLNSAMQSNVPSPFGGMHKFTHLNMPGGAWAQESKFLSHELNSSHYTNLRQEVRSDWATYEDRPIAKPEAFSTSSIHRLAFSLPLANKSPQANPTAASDAQNSKGNAQTTNVTNEERRPEDGSAPVVSRKDRLKKAIKEYGSTVLVFHVSISLVSLGTCYLLVSSGIDMVALLDRMGWGDSALASKAGAGAGTFVIAYAIHKVFAPVRISITLGATPLIVRYLRRKGILKPPASASSASTSTAGKGEHPKN